MSSWREEAAGVFCRLLRAMGWWRAIRVCVFLMVYCALVLLSVGSADPHQRFGVAAVENAGAPIGAPGVPSGRPSPQGYRVYGGSSWLHPLGTDERGRDLLIRLAHGARTSLVAGLVCTVCFLLSGIAFGVAAGYLEGWWRAATMYFFGLMNNFPILLLLLLAVIIIDDVVSSHLLFLRAYILMALLGVFSSPKLGELIRGRIAAMKETAFVQASVALGLSPGTIVVKHILWLDCRPLIVVQAAHIMGQAILVETTLTYLNCGLEYPSVSWGLMIRTMGSGFFQGEPAVLIVMLTMASAVFFFQYLAALLNELLAVERRSV